MWLGATGSSHHLPAPEAAPQNTSNVSTFDQSHSIE